jgi:hypothetical protein
MDNEIEVPKEQFLDYLTRIDELIIQNTQMLYRLASGQGHASVITASQDLQYLRKKVESGEWAPYEVKTFDLSSARDNEKIVIEGDFIHAWTNGTMEGIGIRLGNQDSGIIYFERRNPISGFRFWNIYLTNTAQAGRTLDLMIGREASAYAQTTEVTVSSTQRGHSVRSDKDTNFTGAIAQYAKEDENLTGLLMNKIRITGVSLQSDENLSYRVIFWKTDGFDNTDLDLDSYCGETIIDLPADGFRIGGANQYYLDMRGLDIDYEDDDASYEIHVSLQCLTAAGKSAGAAGEVVIEVYYEPRT